MRRVLTIVAVSVLTLCASCTGSDSSSTDTYTLPDVGDAGPGGWLWGQGAHAESCSGAPGCSCTTDAECDSGKCAESVGGRICAAPCDGGCAANHLCVELSAGGAQQSYCVDRYARLCRPCFEDHDCQLPGVGGAVCVAHAVAGNFCASPCDGSKFDLGCL